MKDIYSDLRGERLGNRVYLYDRKNDVYNPALILWNSLEIKKLIDFLKQMLKELKKEKN